MGWPSKGQQTCNRKGAREGEQTGGSVTRRTQAKRKHPTFLGTEETARPAALEIDDKYGTSDGVGVLIQAAERGHGHRVVRGGRERLPRDVAAVHPRGHALVDAPVDPAWASGGQHDDGILQVVDVVCIGLPRSRILRSHGGAQVLVQRGLLCVRVDRDGVAPVEGDGLHRVDGQGGVGKHGWPVPGLSVKELLNPPGGPEPPRWWFNTITFVDV